MTFIETITPYVSATLLFIIIYTPFYNKDKNLFYLFTYSFIYLFIVGNSLNLYHVYHLTSIPFEVFFILNTILIRTSIQ